MAKKRSPRPKAAAKVPTPLPSPAGVTPERFARLVRLLQFLSTGPQTRTVLARRLRLDVRGFYRDLELLRGAGIDVTLDQGRYALAEPVADAQSRLPFPDPHLTLGEVRQLAKGRTLAHRKLKEQLERNQV
jgi:hypothetical protein